MDLYLPFEKREIIKRNLGIELLRMLLCLIIILIHNYSSKNQFIKSLVNNRFQVPCFFFISFYYLYPIVFRRNMDKMKLRLERLLIPYFVYPIVIWMINNLLFLLIKENRFKRFLTLRELAMHLIIGKGIKNMGVLWFQFNLLIITIFFLLSSFLLKRFYLLFFQIIALISYILQYSEINYQFFSKYTYKIYMPLGNIIETLPIAVCSLSFASLNFFNFFPKDKIVKWICFCSFFFYMISNYKIFSKVEGFGSTGIKPLILSFFLFTIFSMIPFTKINERIFVFLYQITKYTQGIYCLHMIIIYYMRKNYKKTGTLLGSIIVYIISYVISLIGFQIFKKTKLKYLFV